jgi:CubicO group peptidase (beta-lactamase class C family)
VADGTFPGSVSPELALATDIVRQGVAPDAAVGWAARRGLRWDTGYGFAGSVDPIFDLASVTKPMTAVAFARAGLDRRTTLGAVLEEARGTASADVPLELLLAHRAGLEAHLPLHEKLLLGGEVDAATVLRIVADARRADAAGPVPEAGFPPIYSDLGYILAGEVLARSQHARDAGEAIEWLVVDALSASAGPVELGTARSLVAQGIGFEERARKTEVVAWRGGAVRGVVHDENAWALTGSGGSGHAGMFGTAPAVLAFGCAVLDSLKGRGGAFGDTDLSWLVAPRPGGTLRAGFDGKSPPESGQRSSCGARCSAATFGHLGFTGTSLWIDPEADAVVTLLTNRVHPTRDNDAIRTARPGAHDQLFALAAGRREA